MQICTKAWDFLKSHVTDPNMVIKVDGEDNSLGSMFIGASNSLYKHNMRQGADTILAGHNAYLVLREDETIDTNRFMVMQGPMEMPKNECWVFNRMEDFLETGEIPFRWTIDYISEGEPKLNTETEIWELPTINAVPAPKGELPKWMEYSVVRVVID